MRGRLGGSRSDAREGERDDVDRSFGEKLDVVAELCLRAGICDRWMGLGVETIAAPLRSKCRKENEVNIERLPTLTCVDTQPAFVLIHQIDDADFPERAAYLKELLKRTIADLRSTATFLEKELKARAK